METNLVVISTQMAFIATPLGEIIRYKAKISKNKAVGHSKFTSWGNDEKLAKETERNIPRGKVNLGNLMVRIHINYVI